MDCVYILGKGSIWQDNEIRYSLRSIEKHLSNFKDIYVIGELPNFIKGVRHILFDDTARWKETNIYEKVRRACQEQSISEDFLFFNDDHFLLQDFDATKFPFFTKGDLLTIVNKNGRNWGYWYSVKNTYEALLRKEYSYDNFDIHTPIIYNKQKFIEATSQYDWEMPRGYVLKSLYANSIGIKGELCDDCKINGQFDTSTILSMIKDKKVFSIGNKALGVGIQQALQQLYPTPSQWEVS